jgi:hypothetical protein
MSNGPSINPSLNHLQESNNSLNLQEVIILKQFTEKAIRTEGFLLEIEKKQMELLRNKLSNLIETTLALNKK